MYFIRFSTPNRRGGPVGARKRAHHITVCLSWGQEGRFDGRRAGCGRGGDVRRTLYGSNTFPCLLSNTHACSGLVRVTFLFYVFLHFYFTVKTLRKNVSGFYRKISTPVQRQQTMRLCYTPHGNRMLWPEARQRAQRWRPTRAPQSARENPRAQGGRRKPAVRNHRARARGAQVTHHLP